MRVLLLVETLSIGGLPNYVLELARALSERGDQVALAHGGGMVPEYLDCRGVELLALSTQGLDHPYDVMESLQVIRRWRADVLHVHLCSVLPLLQAIASLGIPLLRSFHDYTSMCLRRGRRRFPGDRCARALGWSCITQGCLIGAPRPGGRFPALQNLPAKMAERRLYQAFSEAVVGSQHMRRVLLVNGFKNERVQVVPYFSRFDQQAQGLAAMGGEKAAGVPGRERALRLLFTGQAVKGKGLEVLVKALAQVRGDWCLTTISSGPRLPVAKALAQRYGIAGRIEFIEWLPQEALAGYYRAADLFVLPSVWDDPGPLVGIEAMSFETPVLAFAVGGIADYVHDGKTGLQAAAVSVAGMAQGLQRALDGHVDLLATGRAARELVAQQHGRTRHVDQLQQLYRDALASSQHADPVLIEVCK
jgi:glycosyltransferase involved in cell wall biosynthesis